MQRIQMRKNRLTIRAVERAAKRQCKKDEHQTKALLTKARDWRAPVFDPSSAELVTRQAALVKECLQEARALARSKGETLPWLECLPSGIRASKRLAPFVKQWAQRAARKAAGGEFMVEREDKNNISTGRQGGRGVPGVSSSAIAVGDAQALASEEAKVGVQCEKTDGATTAAVVAGLTERDGDARRLFLPWNGIKMWITWLERVRRHSMHRDSVGARLHAHEDVDGVRVVVALWSRRRAGCR
jgi:hypothetical protein